MPADGVIDGAAAGYAPDHQRQIIAVHRMNAQHLDQHRVRLDAARHDQQSAGVFVDAMHDAGARHSGQPRVPGQQRVLQRARRITRPRVHDQAHRFVDHQQVFILIADIERDGLRQHRLIGRHAGAQVDGLAAIDKQCHDNKQRQ